MKTTLAVPGYAPTIRRSRFSGVFRCLQAGRTGRLLLAWWVAWMSGAASPVPSRAAEGSVAAAGAAAPVVSMVPAASFLTNSVEGWRVLVNERLLAGDKAATEKALELLRAQLREIVRVVPAPAVARLREVTLWFSPPYPGVGPRAEYHPGAGWLRDNGRDPVMAKAVEFTDIRDFEKETRRMPNFTLHELAHAYHDRVLPGGFENAEIRAAYQQAKGSGTYDKVERWLGDGRPNTRERSYALTNPMEYFAESTEAYFARNDFFPFNHAELSQADPGMEQLLGKLWGVTK